MSTGLRWTKKIPFLASRFEVTNTWKTLILYVSVIDDYVGAVLAQYDEEGKERDTYYLSKLFNEAEKKYTAMEKTCARVVWVAQKLKSTFSLTRYN